jgi:flagellar basal-body rod modification protein FlgD
MTVSGITAGSQSTTPNATKNPTDGLANEQTFLKLLVAQIQNQDPLSPTDSMQFVAQLAQFSQLEQLIGIRQDIEAKNTAAANANGNGQTQTTTGAAAGN